MSITMPETAVHLTDDELRALTDAANSTNLWFGPPPSPPTPIMTALRKLEQASERERDE